jgi:hypothetical protein
MVNESRFAIRRKWSPVKVMLLLLLDVSQVRYVYANGRENFCESSRAWLRPTIS